MQRERHGTLRRAFLHVTEIGQDETPDLGDRLKFDLLDTPKEFRTVKLARLAAER